MTRRIKSLLLLLLAHGSLSFAMDDKGKAEATSTPQTQSWADYFFGSSSASTATAAPTPTTADSGSSTDSAPAATPPAPAPAPTPSASSATDSSPSAPASSASSSSSSKESADQSPTPSLLNSFVSRALGYSNTPPAKSSDSGDVSSPQKTHTHSTRSRSNSSDAAPSAPSAQPSPATITPPAQSAPTVSATSKEAAESSSSSSSWGWNPFSSGKPTNATPPTTSATATPQATATSAANSPTATPNATLYIPASNPKSNHPSSKTPPTEWVLDTTTNMVSRKDNMAPKTTDNPKVNKQIIFTKEDIIKDPALHEAFCKLDPELARMLELPEPPKPSSSSSSWGWNPFSSGKPTNATPPTTSATATPQANTPSQTLPAASAASSAKTSQTKENSGSNPDADSSSSNSSASATKSTSQPKSVVGWISSWFTTPNITNAAITGTAIKGATAAGASCSMANSAVPAGNAQQQNTDAATATNAQPKNTAADSAQVKSATDSSKAATSKVAAQATAACADPNQSSNDSNLLENNSPKDDKPIEPLRDSRGRRLRFTVHAKKPEPTPEKSEDRVNLPPAETYTLLDDGDYGSSDSQKNPKPSQHPKINAEPSQVAPTPEKQPKTDNNSSESTATSKKKPNTNADKEEIAFPKTKPGHTDKGAKRAPVEGNFGVDSVNTTGHSRPQASVITWNPDEGNRPKQEIPDTNNRRKTQEEIQEEMSAYHTWMYTSNTPEAKKARQEYEASHPTYTAGGVARENPLTVNAGVNSNNGAGSDAGLGSGNSGLLGLGSGSGSGSQGTQNTTSFWDSPFSRFQTKEGLEYIQHLIDTNSPELRNSRAQSALVVLENSGKITIPRKTSMPEWCAAPSVTPTVPAQPVAQPSFIDNVGLGQIIKGAYVATQIAPLVGEIFPSLKKAWRDYAGHDAQSPEYQKAMRDSYEANTIYVPTAQELESWRDPELEKTKRDLKSVMDKLDLLRMQAKADLMEVQLTPQAQAPAVESPSPSITAAPEVAPTPNETKDDAKDQPRAETTPSGSVPSSVPSTATAPEEAPAPKEKVETRSRWLEDNHPTSDDSSSSSSDTSHSASEQTHSATGKHDNAQQKSGDTESASSGKKAYNDFIASKFKKNVQSSDDAVKSNFQQRKDLYNARTFYSASGLESGTKFSTLKSHGEQFLGQCKINGESFVTTANDPFHRNILSQTGNIINRASELSEYLNDRQIYDLASSTADTCNLANELSKQGASREAQAVANFASALAQHAHEVLDQPQSFQDAWKVGTEAILNSQEAKNIDEALDSLWTNLQRICDGEITDVMKEKIQEIANRSAGEHALNAADLAINFLSRGGKKAIPEQAKNVFKKTFTTLKAKGRDVIKGVKGVFKQPHPQAITAAGPAPVPAASASATTNSMSGGGSGGAAKGAANPLKPSSAASPSEFLGKLSQQTLDEATKYVMEDKNKFNHIFNHPRHDHKLGPLIEKLGGPEEVVRAVLQAAQDKLPAIGRIEDITVDVAGYTVWVRGFVDGGIPKLGTLFIKEG